MYFFTIYKYIYRYIIIFYMFLMDPIVSDGGSFWVLNDQVKWSDKLPG